MWAISEICPLFVYVHDGAKDQTRHTCSDRGGAKIEIAPEIGPSFWQNCVLALRFMFWRSTPYCPEHHVLLAHVSGLVTEAHLVRL